MEIKEFLLELILRLGSPPWLLVMVLIVSVSAFITGATERDFKKGFWIGIAIWISLALIATMVGGKFAGGE